MQTPTLTDPCSQISSMCIRKFGGKRIPIEAFVTRKVAEHELDTGAGLESNGGRIACLEILYLWNMFGTDRYRHHDYVMTSLFNTLRISCLKPRARPGSEPKRFKMAHLTVADALMIRMMSCLWHHHLQRCYPSRTPGDSPDSLPAFVAGAMSVSDLERAERDLMNLAWTNAGVKSGLRSSGVEGMDDDVELMRLLILGKVMSYSRRYSEAIALYRQACSRVPKRETWVWAHAKFEVGCFLLLSVATMDEADRWAQ